MRRGEDPFLRASLWHLLILLLVLLICVAAASQSVAQDSPIQDRVNAALGNVNTGGAIFDTTRMQDTATAFTTTPPPEAAVTGATIQDDTLIKLLSTGQDINAYDKVQNRPRMVIEPTDPRLDPAKWASTTGVGVAGDLQDGTARSCTFRDFGSAPPFQRTCDRFRNFTQPSCKVQLSITGAGDVRDTAACTALEADPLCAASSLTCISGPGTRTIGGVDETRLCWDWQQDYFCHASGQFTNCTPYESNPGCSEIATTCLANSADGTCSHESVSFQCGNPAATVDQSCSAIQVCQGTVCEGIPVQPDTDFAEAAAWINIADQSVKDNNLIGLTCAADTVATSGACPAADIRFFEGTNLRCTSNGLLRNCCNGSGIIVSLLGGCNSAELQIQNAISAGTVHHLGEYCSSSFFGICLARQRTFCDYNSKIARVFQQQAHLQAGLPWGSPQTETCEGLTQAQMASIDYDAIDLTELFSGMLASAGISDPAAVENRLKTRLAGYSGAPSGDLMHQPVDANFNSTNLSATPDPITGAITYTDADATTPPALTYTGTAPTPPTGSGPVLLPANPTLGVTTAIPNAITQGVNSPQTSTATQGDG